MIEVSHIELVGALVYRTKQALLGKNNRGINKYLAKQNKCCYPISNLYYYPGTYEEIKNAFDFANIGNNDNRFPSVLHYQQVTEQISTVQTLNLELAFIYASNNEWTTEQRERNVFEPVLEPIYREFINQIINSGYFDVTKNGLVYSKIKVFTTGNQLINISEDLFGDSVDLIRIRNLSLVVNNTLCEDDIKKIRKEYEMSYL